MTATVTENDQKTGPAGHGRIARVIGPVVDVEFPIADYDDLTVAEIMPLLPQLYSDELGVVAERERNGKNRSSILARLDELARWINGEPHAFLRDGQHVRRVAA